MQCRLTCTPSAFSIQSARTVHRFLLPAMDMVNHDSDANAEVRITSDGELFAARALKHIKWGATKTLQS